MSWGEEDIPGRLTKRQRNWQAKRSVRVLGALGIPPIANPGGTSVMGQRGPVLAVASDFAPDMVPQVSEEDAANFRKFLEANAAEVATWPAWKQRAFRMVKDGER